MAHWLSESASNERKRDMNAETVWSERFKSRPAPIIRRHDRESDEKEKSTVLGMDAEQHFFKRRRCGDDDDGVRTDSSVGTVGYSASEDEGKDVSSHFSRSTVVANTASRPKANPSSIEIANVAEAMCLLPSRNTAICVNENDSDVVIDSPPPPVNEEPSTAAGASVTSDQGAIEQASNQNEQTYNVRGADVNSLDQAEALSARIAAKREVFPRIQTLLFSTL